MFGALTLAVFAVTGLGSERPIGELCFVSGDVALTRPDARPVAGEARMPLQRGDLLKTSAGWVRLDYVPGAAPDDLEGAEWLGLGSDHERIERAFRYRYRDRDCKLLDIRVWTTDSRVQVTLGEVRLQCSDEAAQRKLLKQGHDGWGWLH